MREKQSKKCNVKNQHYVPQFYLKNFSNDWKNIGVFVIDSHKCISSAPIKHQSSEDYFYSTKGDIEKHLGRIESDAKRVIDILIENPKTRLQSSNLYSLYLFTMIQQGRTLANAEFISNHVNATAKEILKIKKELGDIDDIKKLEDIDVNDFKIEINHPGGLSLSAQVALANTCTDLHSRILINQSNRPFLTSDNPVAIYNTFFERMGIGMYALASRGLQIFMPLSDSLGIFFFDPKCYKLGNRKNSFVELNSSSDINELNRLSAVNAGKVVYFKPGSIKETELSILIKNNEKYRTGQKVSSFQERTKENEIAVVTYHKPPLCKISLSFIKEKPEFKALRPKDFKPEKHCYREIAYYKDKIIRATIGDCQLTKPK